MTKKESLIEKYTKEVAELTTLLERKRFEIGSADGANESRIPTGRVELEDAIQLLQNRLKDAKSLLKAVKDSLNAQEGTAALPGYTVLVEMDGEISEFLLLAGLGDFSAGVLSVDSPLGIALVGKNVGNQVVLDSGVTVKILKIS